jgi:RNA polymerase sigma-70 factor (ECF subfamily)
MVVPRQIALVAQWRRFWLAQAARDDAGATAGQAAGHLAARRDARDFEAFFTRFAPQITGYLCRALGDEQAAFDLCQETFFRAWRHFAGLRDRPEARAWLYRVASRLAGEHQRERARHPQTRLADDLLGASDPGRGVAERERVTLALGALTPKQRDALVLHEAQGFSCDEIGIILHMSRAAVKMALFRAREQFRRHYLREEDDA